jgi:predicted transcriptional regulator
MNTKQTLEQFGLHGRKADVYLAALELGGASVIDISRKANIKRTTAYDILLDLKNDGLISETVKGKKRLFIGEDPEKIKKDLEKKEALFSEILPQLKSIYNVKGTKPKIKFYEGKEGLMEAYDDALKYSGEILAFGSEDVRNNLGEDWIEWYINLAESIVARDREHLRICKLIKKEKYPFSIEVDIYGFQKVALISSKEMMAVIIESAEINNTLKWIFELAWDNLPEIKLT